MPYFEPDFYQMAFFSEFFLKELTSSKLLCGTWWHTMTHYVTKKYPKMVL